MTRFNVSKMVELRCEIHWTRINIDTRPPLPAATSQAGEADSFCVCLPVYMAPSCRCAPRPAMRREAEEDWLSYSRDRQLGDLRAWCPCASASVAGSNTVERQNRRSRKSAALSYRVGRHYCRSGRLVSHGAAVRQRSMTSRRFPPPWSHPCRQSSYRFATCEQNSYLGFGATPRGSLWVRQKTLLGLSETA